MHLMQRILHLSRLGVEARGQWRLSTTIFLLFRISFFKRTSFPSQHTKIEMDESAATDPVPPPPGVKDEEYAALDASLAALSDHHDDWVATGLPQRIEYLRNAIARIEDISMRWAKEATYFRGIDPEDPLNESLMAEEILSGICPIARVCQTLLVTLEAINSHEGDDDPQDGVFFPPKKWRTSATGNDVAVVFPRCIHESMSFPNTSAEVWIEKGGSKAQASQLRLQLRQSGGGSEGCVALVLSAGNVNSIGITDAIHKLFIENQVVMIKHNPVNSYIAPFLRIIFDELFENGFLDQCQGGAEIGSYLCQHHNVDTIHITGSQKTHDLIVWGSGEQRITPVCTKSISSELGNVTPVIILPSEYSQKGLRYLARNIAGMMVNNVSFNCIAAKCLVLSAAWKQKKDFLDALESVLEATPQRPAYYPGAKERYDAFHERYPSAKCIECSTILKRSDVGAQMDVLPWMIIPDVPPVKNEYALTHEAFAPLIAQVSLGEESTTMDEFMAQSVEFCNDVLWGSLAAMIMVGPKDESQLQGEIDKMIGDLQYGSVIVNAFAGAAFVFGCTPWGAFPGNSLENAESGIGWVHNTHLYDFPEKGVVKCPSSLPMSISQPWFPDHKNLMPMAIKLLHYYAYPSIWNALRCAMSALRG
eukprot:TRINITY_DN80472_c0_g1_i1.p1 TRINITY_DN80472_c0_g1~~TRINITY_DN80472_c0_g1_i1.p1  ORF type:complete len:647 (-),score=149.74 TRINITY_DN80472_c0_g1_i1:168-2108(-)